MTRPAIRHRRDSHPAPRLTPELLAQLAAHLTPRDRDVLELIWEHRVLTTGQITAIAFPTQVKARHRLLNLYRLSALLRFRPWTPVGSRPWHWVLGPAGAQILAAQQGQTIADLGYRRDAALSIAHSARLGHQIGVNDFFAQLHYLAHHRGDGTRLAAWWSERRCTQLWGDLAHPDAYGRWTQPTTSGITEIDFFLEHDTGTESLHKVVAKLNDYANLAEATGITTPVLFHLPSQRREANLRKALPRTAVPAATAIHATPHNRVIEEGPAGPIWLPCGITGPRRRLIDLADTWTAQRSDVEPG